jgi:hypothetical protein
MTLLLLLNQPPYYGTLLQTACSMLEQGQHEIVAVLAQMACEIFSEQAITAALKQKRLDYLEAPLEDLLPTYSLANDKVRKLYSALTSDAIQEELFWPEYKAAVKLRNDVMHSARRVSKEEAVAALKVADQLIAHLGAVLTRLRTTAV